MNKLQHLQYLNFRKPSRYADNITAIQARPSLDLNFARNKSLMDNVTGNNLITFTRASSGTYVDSAGVLQTASTDVPRFDHNPTTGESLGLLVEEQRTNLLLRSEQLGDPVWPGSTGAITDDSQISPNGQTTADTFTTTSGTSILYQDVACTASTVYTFSFYVRLGTMPASDFRFAVRDNTGAAFIATDIVPNVTPVTTEWRRVSYTFTTPAGCVQVRPYLYRFVFIPGGTVHLWGAQLEAGAFPTSYIPTTTAAATRSADVASITGTNFSNWYNATEGTFYSQYRNQAIGNSPILEANDNTANERINIRADGTDPRFFVNDGGSEQANLNGGTVAANISYKSAGAYKVNDFAFSHIGGTVQTDTSGTLPTVNRLFIGRHQPGAYFNGYIARIVYFNTRISNANLQRITQ